jgi:DNA-binding CsgD family transcriptional regulator
MQKTSTSRAALVEAWLGHAAEARAAARRRLEWAVSRGERPGIARARSVLGLLALSEGDPATAERELSEAVQLLEEMGVGHPGAIPALPDAVEALVGSGDATSAGRLLGRLERQAAAVESPWASAAAERCHGLLLFGDGDADAAVARLEAAAASFDLLWEARAVEELERVAPGRAAGELTKAERRIAALVADGRKNREIGEELFMSVATVEAHLTRVYRKLEIGSRSELARLVADGTVALSDEDRE